MTKSRIEAFSDGMFAIIITIMLLEIKFPKVYAAADFLPVLPALLSYGLCFVVTGGLWISHHRMFHKVQHIGGWVLWANLNLLFWLSLMPVFTGVIGEDGFNGFTVTFYTFEYMMCAVSYRLLVLTLRAEHGKDSQFIKDVPIGLAEHLVLSGYILSVPLSLYSPRAALVLLVFMVALTIFPERRNVFRLSKV